MLLHGERGARALHFTVAEPVIRVLHTNRNAIKRTQKNRQWVLTAPARVYKTLSKNDEEEMRILLIEAAMMGGRDG